MLLKILFCWFICFSYNIQFETINFANIGNLQINNFYMSWSKVLVNYSKQLWRVTYTAKLIFHVMSHSVMPDTNTWFETSASCLLRRRVRATRRWASADMRWEVCVVLEIPFWVNSALNTKASFFSDTLRSVGYKLTSRTLPEEIWISKLISSRKPLRCGIPPSSKYHIFQV